MKRIVILASGDGSLAQAIIDATQMGDLDVEIAAVLSDRPGAHVLERAKNARIETEVVPMEKDRALWDRKIFDSIQRFNPNLVVSAGFMRILAPNFVNHFKVINTHPALLPMFPGAHAVKDALVAGVSRSGATVFWVDEGVDTGKIISQAEVDVLPGDDEKRLHERIKIVERLLIVSTIKELLPILENTHE